MGGRGLSIRFCWPSRSRAGSRVPRWDPDYDPDTASVVLKTSLFTLAIPTDRQE